MQIELYESIFSGKWRYDRKTGKRLCRILKRGKRLFSPDGTPRKVLTIPYKPGSRKRYTKEHKWVSRVLGSDIVEARESVGMTQEMLAVRCGWSPSTQCHKYEQRETRNLIPTKRVQAMICILNGIEPLKGGD